MVSSPRPRLLLLGAGPKSIAVCAKAAVLSGLDCAVPQIDVLERRKFGAHWSGDGGYTDGLRQLGTPPEKDVGFPYDCTCWGPCSDAVNEQMVEFSWQTYLISQCQFGDWVDRGRCHPSHKEWAKYLDWCGKKARDAFEYRQVDVLEIDLDEDGWEIHCKDAETTAIEPIRGDGLMITGPGDPLRLPNQPLSHPRITDGRTFWLKNNEIWSLAHDDVGFNVAVVGAGETAAAVAVALSGESLPIGKITIINPFGVLYSRGESYTENRMFTQPSDWRRLQSKERRELVRRADRGVFSLQAQEVLNKNSRTEVVAGRVVDIKATNDVVHLLIDYNGDQRRLSCEYLVVCTGFFSLSFLRLLAGEARARLFRVLDIKQWSDVENDREMQKAIQGFLEDQVMPDLSLKDFEPKLHLPMLSGVTQGPGFPNLSCLGSLSDRVLGSYVPVPSLADAPQTAAATIKRGRDDGGTHALNWDI